VIPAGTILLAASSYAFLVLAARVLGPERYASFAVVWALVFFVGPGVFTPVEQQAARSVASARAASGRLRRQVVRAAQRSAALVALLLLALVATRGVLARELELDDALLAGLAASLLGLSVAHPLRGVLAGLGRLPAYGYGLGLEGMLRLTGGVALTLSGTRSAALFGALAGMPAGLGAALGALRRRPAGDRAATSEALAVEAVPEDAGNEGVGGLVALVVAALCGQLLINVAPVVVAALASPAERSAAGQLLAGLLVARVPLLAIATVQTVVLPRLVAQHAEGRSAQVARTLRTVAAACVALAVVGAVVGAAVGPFVMGLAFGPAFALTSLDLVLLIVSVCAYLAATLLGLGLVAAHRGAALAWSWVAGVTVAVLVLAAVPGLVLRVELALLAGCCTSAVLVASRTLGRPGPPSREGEDG